jgi:putative endopeptidase
MRLKQAAEIPQLIAHYGALGVDAPYFARVGQDARESTRYAVAIEQGGLGLPDRDYYLLEDAKLVEIRGRYREHIERMLALAGASGPSGGRCAGDIAARDAACAGALD